MPDGWTDVVAQTLLVSPIEMESKWNPSSSPSTRKPEQTSFAERPATACEDSQTMASRVSSADFVGRTAELAELEAALADAASSRPSLAFVAGESGVGKTRLADELILRARASGARVLVGECVDLGSSELPYAPLIGALRPLARDGDPALDRIPASARSDLATFLPSLAGGTAAASNEPAPSRVFEALLTLFDTLGDDTPVVLMIEDLHWADGSTRGFVSYLSRMLCGERLLVVGTYRTDELHRRHPLRPLLAELTRDAGTRHIELPRFTREEMTAQLSDILGHEPGPALVERLHKRSEGNALFTEELLATGIDGHGALPPTLRDALMLRVERLSPEAQEVLRWLACQPMDDALLATVIAMDPRTMAAALREAVSSHIIVAHDSGAFDFRHALLREVVHDDLLPGERTSLHAQLAAALEQRLEAEGENAHNTASVAHHLYEAGDQPRALAASLRAGRAAEGVQAWPEAMGFYERALELWERVPEPERHTSCDRAELLARTAQAAYLAGDSARQETLLEHALELVDPTTDPRRAASLLERLARAQWDMNRQDHAVETLDRALALLEPDELTSERAALLAAKTRARMLQGKHGEAIEVGGEALAVARAIGDRRAEVRALSSLGAALFGRGEDDDGTEALRTGIALADGAEMIDELCALYVNLGDMLHLAGRSDEALAVIHEGLDRAGTVVESGIWLRLLLSEVHLDLGDWDAAEVDIPRLERGNVGTTLLNQRLRRAELLLGRGDLVGAREQMDAAERTARGSTEPQFLGVIGIDRGLLELRSGDFEEARCAVDDALDLIEFCSEDFVRISRLAGVGAMIEADAAQSARDRRDEAAELAAIERAEGFLARARATAEAGGLVEEAQRLLVEAERARTRGDDDAALWRAAAEAFSGIHRPYPAAYSRWRAAEALVRADDREDAAVEAGTALEAARQLGSVWLAAEVSSLASRARLKLPGELESEVGAAAVAEGDDPFGLTARERQVLALVSEGRTNREIGLELHMAEKTASVHVSRILAKLDVRSRTEAAGVAHRLGLAGTASV